MLRKTTHEPLECTYMTHIIHILAYICTQFEFFSSSSFCYLSCSHRFLGTLKQHTIQSSVHGEDDLNVEHLQLLLLLFHNLSERGRRTVLTLVTQAITEVAQSRDSQLKAVPLNLARLCLVFDYLLRHYSKAPLYLFEQVNCLFSNDGCLALMVNFIDEVWFYLFVLFVSKKNPEYYIRLIRV